MDASARRTFVGTVAAALAGGLLVAPNSDGQDPHSKDSPKTPSNKDIQKQLISLSNQLAELDQKLSLAGPVEEQLGDLRDAVENIAVRLNKTEPLIAARIQQVENTVAEMKRGSEALVPLIG